MTRPPRGFRPQSKTAIMLGLTGTVSLCHPCLGLNLYSPKSLNPLFCQPKLYLQMLMVRVQLGFCFQGLILCTAAAERILSSRITPGTYELTLSLTVSLFLNLKAITRTCTTIHEHNLLPHHQLIIPLTNTKHTKPTILRYTIKIINDFRKSTISFLRFINKNHNRRKIHIIYNSSSWTEAQTQPAATQEKLTALRLKCGTNPAVCINRNSKYPRALSISLFNLLPAFFPTNIVTSLLLQSLDHTERKILLITS